LLQDVEQLTGFPHEVEELRVGSLDHRDGLRR